MALVIADRVKETTTTTGTGTYTLAGAENGFESFASIGNSNTTYYACVLGSNFEVGIGTYTSSGTTLARTTILQSSNSDNAVDWPSGTKVIFCTQPAEKAVYLDASGNIEAFNASNLTNLNASNLASGTVADARLPATISSDITGNAGTATALETARNIGGVSFNGTANINLPGVNQSGNQDTSGNAGTATALATGRNFSLTGDVTASAVSFDGTGNVALSTTIAANSVALGTDTTGNYVASLVAGNLVDLQNNSGESATPTVDVDLNELTTSTSNADGDFFVVVDSGGTQRKLTKGNINNSGFNNDAGYTTNTGDITGVTAGNGLTGGGSSGGVSLAVGAGTLIDVAADSVNVDLSELTTSTADGDGDFFAVVDAANAQKKLTKGNINLSGFNNDSSFIDGSSLNASNLSSGTVPNARLDAQLQDVAGLAVTDGNFIVGDGSNFVAESGSTARSSLGLGTASVLDTGISNTNIPKFTSGVADNDFLRVDGTAVEGRSASEVLSDIGGQASLTFGISNTNAVKIDSSSVADDEYARFTANGLESRSTSEVLSDIGAITASSTDTLTNKTINASQLSGTVANARLDAQLQDVAGLAVTNGGFIVGDGSNFVLETGSTARASLGLGTASTLDTGISNTNVPKFTSGVADNDFLRVDGTAIEGRSASEVLSDIGGQASLTFGISNTNAVKIDSTSVADDEYARFTANGLESRSTSEVLSDIGAITASSTDTLTNKTINASQLSGTVANARLDQQLQDVAGLAVTNGNFIVGDGSNFIAESGSTARTSLGLGTAAVLNTGISNTNVPKFTSGVVDNDFLRVDGTAIEGRSASEVLSDIGGQASLTFGISNTNAVKIDSSSVADNEFARFTANGLESRSAAEVKSDLGLGNLDYGLVTGSVTGTEDYGSVA